jgi:hypothetical protein
LRFVGDPIQIMNGTGDCEGMTGIIEIEIPAATSTGGTETVSGTTTMQVSCPIHLRRTTSPIRRRRTFGFGGVAAC